MIQTTTNKNIYLGDGTTRRFAITFQYETKNNLKQINLYKCTYTTDSGTTKYNNDVTEITTNYDYEIVDGVTYVVYPSDAAVSDGASPMASGTAIIIMRDTPQEQLSTGPYNSNSVMTQLDKLTMIAQDIQEQVNRCYKKPEYSEQVNDIDLDPTGNIEQIFEAAHDAQVAAEDAEDYASNASTYATNASNSATNASKWAEGTDTEVSALGGTKSAKNWASDAASSATSAASSVTACETVLSKITTPLLGFSWFDHLLNDQRWLRADTFSWQSGETYFSVYQHLLDDIGYVRYMIPNDDIQEKFYRSPSDDTTMFAWTNQYSTLYTENEFPENGDDFYYHNQVFGTVLSTGTEAGSGVVTPTTETIAGTTITYYPATDGHKIVLADQETNVQSIYTATGVAWYYILDTANTRFKLPRSTNGHGQLIESYYDNEKFCLVYEDGWCVQGGQVRNAVGGDLTITQTDLYKSYGNTNYFISKTLITANSGLDSIYLIIKEKANSYFTSYTTSVGANNFDWYACGYVQIQTNPYVSQYKYLYFYVGQFTQSATEQTAGLNSELFNGKADINLNNITNIDKIATALGPNTDAGVSLPSGTTLTQNGWIVCSFTDTSYGVGKFKLDNVIMYQCSYQTAANTYVGTFFGSKGQVFTIETTGTCTATATFYPVKGV